LNRGCRRGYYKKSGGATPHRGVEKARKRGVARITRITSRSGSIGAIKSVDATSGRAPENGSGQRAINNVKNSGGFKNDKAYKNLTEGRMVEVECSSGVVIDKLEIKATWSERHRVPDNRRNGFWK